MKYLKWTVILLLLAVVAAVLHYILPSRDVVRIVGTEVRLETVSETASDGTRQILQDDVYFIKTVEPDGSPRVYRNEDNFWYFKFDSANLDTAASNMVSTEAAPRWVVMKHYGWRIPFLSMYPNAISMRPAAGPDEDLFPWFNLIVVAILVTAVLVLWRAFRIMHRRHVDPLVAEVDRRFDEGGSWWRRRWRRR